MSKTNGFFREIDPCLLAKLTDSEFQLYVERQQQLLAKFNNQSGRNITKTFSSSLVDSSIHEEEDLDSNNEEAILTVNDNLTKFCPSGRTIWHNFLCKMLYWSL